MALIDRLARQLVDSDVPLQPEPVLQAARRLLQEEAPLAPWTVANEVVDAVLGLGPIEPLLRDPDVSDVLVNGPDEVWVERRGELFRTDICFANDDEIVAAVERAVAKVGLRIDHASPAVDARLPDGSRLHAVIPPAAVDGPVLAVRRFTEAVESLDGLAAASSATEAQVEALTRAVVERHNLLVSGPTGAGKTTLLNALSKLIPEGQRVVTVEDAAELRLGGHVIRLEGRPPNAEGAGALTLQTLVRHALRLRPDRIIVGEARGPEALDMIQAMSTGHRGSMSTVHADSAEEALLRLENLALSGPTRVSADAVRRQLWAAIDLVVQVERRDGMRRIAAVAEVDRDGTCRAIAC